MMVLMVVLVFYMGNHMLNVVVVVRKMTIFWDVMEI